MLTNDIISGLRIHSNQRKMKQLLLVFLLTMSSAFAGDPQFDPTTLMKLVLVPADAAVGSVIYRLRATDVDFDYPLQFELLDEAAKTTIKIDTLPCSRYNSVCQANVVLQRRLEPGRYHDFRVRIRDTKGGSSTISCTISATNSTTPRDTIFPHIPELIMIAEDAKRGTELGYVVARKNPLYPKPVYLELWGSSLFAIRQRAISDENTEGTIFLLGPLDFEKQAMFHLTVLANDAYAIPKQDSRNIAGVQIVVVVQDVQDQPPVFTSAPPVTQLDNSLVPGDIIVRVHAEDGDKGTPRQIQYGLVSEGNPFTPFFNISEKGGEIILARPLEEITAISHPGVPILLTVVAEEVKTGLNEPPAMSSTVQLALILGERGNQPPYFDNENYVSRIDENAPQGTALVFADPYLSQVSDDDMGKNGVFSLTLENNNGTFEISPNVAERRAQFLIKVRDNTYLDYEQRQSVVLKIIAQELGPASNLSATAEVTVFINDINDNPPVFLQDSYEVELPENMTAGTRVVQITAEDVDTGIYGKVRYTQILGQYNTSLNLDPTNGIITVLTDSHGFDREIQQEYHLYIEARDEDGEGNRATVPLVIKLIDVNDNAPVFEKSIYEFILALDLRNFTSPAIIHAIDNDSGYPNNEVRYEITHGNYENKFAINAITGEIYLKEPLTKAARRRRDVQFVNNPRNRRKRQDDTTTEVFILTARAYDLGVPHLSSNCEVRVYPPESRARTMVFVVAGKNPDRRKTEDMLTAITGGRVTIQEIRPYNGREIGATDITAGDSSKEKSVVVASVLYNSNSIVDVSHLQQNINKTATVTSSEDASVKEYRSDSSSLLFWLLLLLAFLILALLILLLCCLCQGCPLYTPLKRAIQSNSVAENVHLVHNEKGIGHENKSVQAVEWGGHATRKEAWSADIADTRTKATQWQFNKRNQKQKESISIKGYDNGSLKDIRASDEKSTLRLRDGPHVIYSRDWQRRNQRNSDKDMYIEDMDGDYTSVSRLEQTELKHPNRVDDDYDGESLRRHELERGSDAEYRTSVRRGVRRQHAQVETEEQPAQDGREQLFIRDGNTEILRLITRGRPEEIAQALQQQQQLQLQQQQQLQQRQYRPMTLVGGPQQPQYIMVDSGKDILMQRFIEQQQILHPNQVQTEYIQRLPANVDVQQSGAPSLITQSEINQPIPGLNVPSQRIAGSEANVVPTNTPLQSQTRRSTPNQNMLMHQELLETSLRQQNELLRQILLEKERLQQKHEEMIRQDEMRFETQSLPGHSVMATQTDVNTSTQTDLQDLRPDRRRARSDNDDSFSDEDDDYDVYVIGNGENNDSIRWLKRRKFYKRRRSKFKVGEPRRILRVVEEVKRKIKTPILEESESPEVHKQRKPVETTKRNYGETKASILRKKKIEEQVAKDEEYRKVQDEMNIKSAIRKEVLLEISESLDDQIVPTVAQRRANLEKLRNKKYYHESEPESDEGEVYDKRVRKFAEVFSDDSLDLTLNDGRNVNENSVSTKKNKDKRNLIFSRQGSSTDARDVSEADSKSLRKLSTSFEEEDSQPTPRTTRTSDSKAISDKSSKHSDSTPRSQSQKSTKTAKSTDISPRSSERAELEQKKFNIEDKKIDVSKSVPRYMQWYKKDKPTKPENPPVKPKTDSLKKRKLPPKKPNRKDLAQRNAESVQKINTKQLQKENKERPKPSPEPVVKNEQKPPPVLKDQLQVQNGVNGNDPGQGRPLLQHSEHRYEHRYTYPPILYGQPAQIPQHLFQQPVTYLQGPPVPMLIQPSPAEGSTPVPSDNAGPAVPQQNGSISQHTTTEISSQSRQPHSLDNLAAEQDRRERERTSLKEKRDLSQSQPLLKVGGLEDDFDSGIAMTSLLHGALKRPAITEKKSVFTIAYDDMHTKQLGASETPPY